MTFRALALLSFTLFSVPALVSDWTIDSAHSEADFKVRHMGISYVNGTLGTITGTIHLDEGDIAKSSVAISIDVSQIETREPKRNAHLKNPDFFDVGQVSDRHVQVDPRPAGEHQLEVQGHGRSHPARRDQVGGPGVGRRPFGSGQGSVGELTHRRECHHPGRPSRLWPRLEQASRGGRWHAGRRRRRGRDLGRGSAEEIGLGGQSPLTLRRSRQAEKEGAPMIAEALGPDSSAVRLDDSLGDVQAKAVP